MRRLNVVGPINIPSAGKDSNSCIESVFFQGINIFTESCVPDGIKMDDISYVSTITNAHKSYEDFVKYIEWKAADVLKEEKDDHFNIEMSHYRLINKIKELHKEESWLDDGNLCALIGSNQDNLFLLGCQVLRHKGIIK